MNKSSELANMEENERRMLQRIRVADLVVVTAYNESKMTVDVKPLVKREISGTYVSPPPVLSVKIAHIPFKPEMKVSIKPGDIGIILYLDLDSDNAIRTGAESQPNSIRIHSGDDAVFIGVISPG